MINDYKIFNDAMKLGTNKQDFNEEEAGSKLKQFYDKCVKGANYQDLLKLKNRRLATEFKDLIELELFNRSQKVVHNDSIKERFDFTSKQAREFIDGVSGRQGIPARNVRGYEFEQSLLSEMTDELLEESERIMDESGIVVKTSLSQSELNRLKEQNESRYGKYGIPLRAKKIVIESDDKRIIVNNEAIQESFRAPYYRKLVQLSGIDLDLESIPSFSKEQCEKRKIVETTNNQSDQRGPMEIDLDDYESF